MFLVGTVNVCEFITAVTILMKWVLGFLSPCGFEIVESNSDIFTLFPELYMLKICGIHGMIKREFF